MVVANSIACYDTATITAVKSFIVQAQIQIVVADNLANKRLQVNQP